MIRINVLVITILGAMFIPFGLASDAEITVVGVVTEDGYLELNDQKRIKVMDTEMGIELQDRVGKKIEVLGIITEEEGIKTIRVSAFTTLVE